VVRLDVFLAPSELTPAALDGRIVAVIDVLRATTTIASALHAGARTVIPFLDTEDAVRTAKQFERGEVKLAGERHMVAIEGFDLGNSPLEFTPESVGQQTVLLTTTNGTRALLAADDAKGVFVASYANFSVTLERLQIALDTGRRGLCRTIRAGVAHGECRSADERRRADLRIARWPVRR
jgi:2-phosphosulfolactate phosphatase